MAAKSDAKIQAEAVAKLKRYGRKETLFRVPGEGNRGEWRTIKSPFAPHVVTFIRGKYPTAVIANEDFEAAARDWTQVCYDPVGSGHN